MTRQQSGSFTSGYEEFWRKTKGEIHSAVATNSIILDSNSIHSLYRMNRESREEYLTVLEELSPRIFIPRHVADEFHKNRLSSVDTHINGMKAKSKTVKEKAEELRSAIRDFARLRSLASGRESEYLAPFNAAIAQITDEITKEVTGFDLNTGRLASDDPILQRLATIFNGRVGDGFDPEELKQVTAEALERAAAEIPPGYKDVQERGDKGVGDYVIWREMINYASSNRLPILFVSNDVKPDWVRIQCGLTIGSRPELVREMREKAGVNFLQIPLPQFLAAASAVLQVSVSQDTIDQASERMPEGINRLVHDYERARTDLSEVDALLSVAKEHREAAMALRARAQHTLAEVLNTEVTGEASSAHVQALLAQTQTELADASMRADSVNTEFQELRAERKRILNKLSHLSRKLRSAGIREPFRG
ncbi:PIN-like domain-containing protein [Streptomyces sp. NBC_00287]|uniref:PIN domain-containing protein n=1 Tax=Streptomyces sp. NBC_00287 TaxID=2975702 RepID=UPI002E27FEA4|nr:PIN-like domain-containing protein [Streptomyces sp. NBC_00287]